MLLSTNSAESWRINLLKLVWPYVLVAGILLAVFIALLLLGLDLGYFDDTLYTQYLYQNLGVREANQWLFSLDNQRHPIAKIIVVFVHKLLGGSDTAWFGSAIFFHLLNGVLVFLLLDTLLRYRARVLSFIIALVFVFNMRQTSADFGIAMQGFLRVAFGVALLSLWCFLLYVRSGRRVIWWRDLSIFLYILGFSMYETNALFFMLHPVLAHLEDRYNGKVPATWRHWLLQQTTDSIWYPTTFTTYWVLLSVLFPSASANLVSSGLIKSFINALSAELNPSYYLGQIGLAVQGNWSLLAVGGFLIFFIIIWFWERHLPNALERTGSESNYDLKMLFTFGIGLFVVNVMLIWPTGWDPTQSPRVMYPTSLSVAIIITVGVYLILNSLSSQAFRQIALALIAAVLIAVGFTNLFQTRHEYDRQHEARQAVLDAIKRVVPSWKGDISPYILIISEAHPTKELWLHSQDVNFPLMFDLLYDTEGIQADAIYFDLPDSAAPRSDMLSHIYHGPYILADDEGFYSPLRPVLPRPYAPAPLNSLVVIYYDSQTKTAKILDEIPADVLNRGNIVVRTSVPLKTNRDLIGE